MTDMKASRRGRAEGRRGSAGFHQAIDASEVDGRDAGMGATRVQKQISVVEIGALEISDSSLESSKGVDDLRDRGGLMR